MRDTPSDVGLAIRERAIRLGFDSVGITALRASDHAGFLREWLGRGRHGDMDWLARPDAVEARTDPRSRWPALRSAIVVTMNYGGTGAGSRGGTDQARTADRIEGDDTTDASRAIIARYARGRDYHRVMKKKLLLLLREVESIAGHELPAARAYVDTGPVLERELAQRAGLGWFGRNTMLIHPRRGSYSFLAALLTELDIEGDTEPVRDHCGTCNACVEACPTGALLGRDDNGAPVIDATRCISYLTIEHRGAIPRELRPLIGNRVFGCDICQECCPYTRKFSRAWSDPSFAARAPGEPPFGVQLEPGASRSHPGTASPSLIALLETALDEAAWDSFSKGSAIRRAGRAGFARNACVGLGNWGSPDAVPALARALSDADPLVRAHAAWALGRVGSAEARSALWSRVSVETDASVLDELSAAMDA
jgi:epoxyqueuosine reductase